MDEDGDDELLALLDDEYARAVLPELTTEPTSASELCTVRDMSDPTAYRRLERNDAPKLRSLALGIGLLTTGVVLIVTVANVAGAGTGEIPIARGLVTVAGLCAVLVALLYR